MNINVSSSASFTIKPIQLNSKPIPYQAWLNSPKSSNPIQMIRQHCSPFDPQYRSHQHNIYNNQSNYTNNCDDGYHNQRNGGGNSVLTINQNVINFGNSNRQSEYDCGKIHNHIQHSKMYPQNSNSSNIDHNNGNQNQHIDKRESITQNNNNNHNIHRGHSTKTQQQKKQTHFTLKPSLVLTNQLLASSRPAQTVRPYTSMGVHQSQVLQNNNRNSFNADTISQSNNRNTNTNLNISENKSPNGVSEYSQMHNKLNGLEDRLNIMRNKFNQNKNKKKDINSNKLQKIQNKQIVVELKQSKQAYKKQQGITYADMSLQQVVTQLHPPSFLAMTSTKLSVSSNSISTKPSSFSSLNRHFLSHCPSRSIFRNNLYYIGPVLEQYQQQNSLVREHLTNSILQLKTLCKVTGFTKQELEKKKLKLVKKPKYENKITLVFDLDETLIHCNQSHGMPYDTQIKIKFPTGQIVQAGINIRPYAKELLVNLSNHFQLIVFTASHSCYANEVLDYLDPDDTLISHRLFREHCYQSTTGTYIKDLRIIDRDLSQLVLIDNAAYSYCLQLDNGIPILPYYAGQEDCELKTLEQYFMGMISKENQKIDVRDYNRKIFQLCQYVNFDDATQLVKSLYIKEDHC